MNTPFLLVACILACVGTTSVFSEAVDIDVDDQGQPALTIYNGGYAVVRHTFPVNLMAGENEVRFAGATAQVEPDSVILRDRAGKQELAILEQSYRNDPVSQARLLEAFEGQTIEFLEPDGNGGINVIEGTIIRSGFVGGQAYGLQRNTIPIIEVDGKVRFGLPGTPMFPSLEDDTLLEPTLSWMLRSNADVSMEAELAYLSGGMMWEADYNLVMPAEDDATPGSSKSIVDMLGWVTFQNNTGQSFHGANIKLLAGEVNRAEPKVLYERVRRHSVAAMADTMEANVTSDSLDEYHLYSIARPTTLRDGEQKQVEFVRSERVEAETLFVFDGARAGYKQGGSGPQYGVQAQPVWVMREFENAEENGLGIALPAGTVRFYQEDKDGALQFVGENRIDHTPKGETIRLYTGDAFDVVGERTITNNERSDRLKRVDQAIRVELRNAKDTPVTVRVVEHLGGYRNWDILASSVDFEKQSASKVEARVEVPAEGEVVIEYEVRFTW